MVHREERSQEERHPDPGFGINLIFLCEFFVCLFLIFGHVFKMVGMNCGRRRRRGEAQLPMRTDGERLNVSFGEKQMENSEETSKEQTHSSGRGEKQGAKSRKKGEEKGLQLRRVRRNVDTHRQAESSVNHSSLPTSLSSLVTAVQDSSRKSILHHSEVFSPNIYSRPTRQPSVHSIPSSDRGWWDLKPLLLRHI